jgi:choline dehydrogenase-like flavoprotein
MSCAEMQLRARVKDKLGRIVTIGRAANITTPLNGRAACHYCGPCERGCVTRSYFNSAFTTVADAMKTGRCTLITNAMVYKVVMDEERPPRRASSTSTASRASRKRCTAGVVILCAQALESARVLFNSATRQYGDGLANSSGVLGKYLQDHLWVAGGANGEFPDLPMQASMDGRGGRTAST